MNRIEVDHPSTFIQDELDAREWSRDQLSAAMIGDAGRNKLALDMYFEVGPEAPNMRMGALAGQFSVAFGISKEYFLNMEAAWLNNPAEKA